MMLYPRKRCLSTTARAALLIVVIEALVCAKSEEGGKDRDRERRRERAGEGARAREQGSKSARGRHVHRFTARWAACQPVQTRTRIGLAPNSALSVFCRSLAPKKDPSQRISASLTHWAQVVAAPTGLKYTHRPGLSKRTGQQELV